jgi:hypothetical protein
LSETVDVVSLRRVIEKLNALTEKAKYDGAGRYWAEAEDWRELRELVSLSVRALAERKEATHTFGASGQCSGCGMKKHYFERATTILEGWPEDSEKVERLAELRSCRNRLRGGQALE